MFLFKYKYIYNSLTFTTLHYGLGVYQLDKTRIIEKGTLIHEIPPLEGPVGKAVEHFLD